MEITSDMYSSTTLATMDQQNVPKTICATCQNAFWYTMIQLPHALAPRPKVFCKIMKKDIEDDLTACDGNPV
jgi:hypothetical protein